MSTSDRRGHPPERGSAPAGARGTRGASHRDVGRADPDAPRAGRTWLWDHIGRLAGIALGVLAFAALVFLAAIGFKPALFLIVLLVAGVVIIAVGGRIRSA